VSLADKLGPPDAREVSSPFRALLLRPESPRAARGAGDGVGSPDEFKREIGGFLSKKPYTPPSWASDLSLVPSHNFTLGQVSFSISIIGSILGLISMQI
jgi:hypothetical protein